MIEDGSGTATLNTDVKAFISRDSGSNFTQGTLVDVGTGDDLDAHLHFKIHPSVCTNVTVNYTPDNQYNALKRAGAPALLQVPAVVLNVQFTETKLLTTEDIQEGY